MHVLMLSKALVWGAYHKKVQELVNIGVKMDVAIPTHWGKYKSEISKAINYDIHQLPVFFSGKNHFHFYSGLSLLVDSIVPDIFHIDEEPYSLVTYQAMRIAKKKNIKALFFTWQNIYKRYPFPFSLIEKYNYQNASVAIAGNYEAKNILRRKGFIKDIFVIPQFGVDLQLFSKQDVLGLKESIFHSSQVKVVGFIGRLVEEKGIITLLDSFSRLNCETKLLIIGSGPLKKKVLKLISERKRQADVVVIDNIPSELVPKYLNCLDCLVLPSLTKPHWKEQFGRVIIEAMACGIPVVGSDSGEIPNVIGDAGLIFKEGNVEDLREKLELILNNSDLKEEYSKRGYERVKSKFTQKHIAEQTLEVYQHILKS